ncbi:MAG: type IV toxin-antitoxin system AbiEi family antitoxin domain-containing protein [Oceanipulchritudo sp.]
MIQLHRWCASGKLVRLRRGMYAFGEEYGKKPVNPARLANHLYGPSYLSLQWALSYHGLIPEAVFELTSVTTRQTKRFENPFGRFSYRSLKRERFWGYRSVEFANGAAQLASPEKALIDYWYLDRGAWTLDRMREMRFQNFDRVDAEALRGAVQRFGSAKVEYALKTWENLQKRETEGTVEL